MALQAMSFFEFCLGERGFKVSAYAACKGGIALVSSLWINLMKKPETTFDHVSVQSSVLSGHFLSVAHNNNDDVHAQ